MVRIRRVARYGHVTRWDVHHRGYRYQRLAKVLTANGWVTAHEQAVRDAREAQKAEQAAAAAAAAEAAASAGTIETASDIVSLGNAIAAAGYQVGEHPAFGGMCDCHSPTGYHPQGRAIDVNADGHPSGESAALDALNARLQQNPNVVELLWRVAGHFDHLHVAE